MPEVQGAVAGIDAGTECVKAVIVDQDRTVIGRTVVPLRGYFQDRIQEALNGALDDAQVAAENLAGIGATGYGQKCVPGATLNAAETTCHALGAFHHCDSPMTVIDIGGREPEVIRVDATGRPTEIYTLRRCAVGIGSFLMFAARCLDVHPTQLEELAATADNPARVGSYCSIFAGGEILNLLREGVSREEIALGCLHSIAERIVEIDGFQAPLKVTGGVPLYFPGVLKTIAELTGLEVVAVPEPILTGALGAALLAEREG